VVFALSSERPDSWAQAIHGRAPVPKGHRRYFNLDCIAHGDPSKSEEASQTLAVGDRPRHRPGANLTVESTGPGEARTPRLLRLRIPTLYFASKFSYTIALADGHSGNLNRRSWKRRRTGRPDGWAVATETTPGNDRQGRERSRTLLKYVRFLQLDSGWQSTNMQGCAADPNLR
jgi:hypothetical protein